ncbi:exopolysaccharide biosynthesis polyprenyl glycosylphosphotransferase [Falsiroseomonas sp. CW058]|uniref:exopolysaccharide biosynthesis polyprenyl glycosylphosphotransferase n=1 Tax=Falsiroseomonas sp. CW058 TaxID=3388664 RepID=UPI003D316891
MGGGNVIGGEASLSAAGLPRDDGLPHGVAAFRPQLADGAWPREAANDAVATRAAPISPLLLSSLVLLLDIVAVVGAGMAADALTGATGARHAAVTTLVAGLTIACGLAHGGYDHAMLFSFGRQIRRMAACAGGALAAAAAAAAAFGATHRLDPLWLGAAAPLGALSLLGGRAAVAGLLRQRSTRTARRAVIIGTGPQATRLVASMKHDPAGLHILGVVDERTPRGLAAPDGVPPLGGLSTLAAMIRRNEVDVVVLAMPWSAETRVAQLLERLSAFPVELRVAPDLLADQLPGRAAGWPVLLRAQPISGLAGALKRAEDIVMALLALAVAAVPMLLIAAAVKLDSPGPVLFRQRRTGFNNQPFDVLKFRSMYAHHTDHDVQRQVLAGDPRVTRVGAVLRRTSLDELPQLLNVLRGEMSFVGPRPHAPGTRAGGRLFDEVVANYAARHRVKPGLTGLAQVRGWRGPTLNDEQILKRVESDLEYIDRWSVWLDIAIIFRTMLAVVRMRNAL